MQVITDFAGYGAVILDHVWRKEIVTDIDTQRPKRARQGIC